MKALRKSSAVLLLLTIFIFGCKQKEKQETIIIDGQKITTTESEKDLSGDYSLRILNDQQFQKIQKDIEEARIFAQKYSDKTHNILDSENLDFVLKKWKENSAHDKESEEKVVELLGSAFGQNIVDGLDCEWKILSDDYGTDFTVIHREYAINGFPYSSVYKIVAHEPEKSLHGIELVLKNEIQAAKNGSGVERRVK